MSHRSYQQLKCTVHNIQGHTNNRTPVWRHNPNMSCMDTSHNSHSSDNNQVNKPKVLIQLALARAKTNMIVAYINFCFHSYTALVQMLRFCFNFFFQKTLPIQLLMLTQNPKTILLEMRKRKYAHLKNGRQVPDFLTEDIDALYTNIDKIKYGHPDTEASMQDFDSTTPSASVHNLVATARILSTCKFFDLCIVSRLLPNASYDKQKFAAITVRLNQPYCTILLFTSGKMVLTGCKDYVECCWASLNIIQLLRQSLPHFYFLLQDVTIQNIVGNVDLRLSATQKMDLDRLYAEENIFCTYQKTMFPGLIYRANNCPVVLLLFCSGKIVITGGKSRRDVLDGWAALWPRVKSYIQNIPNPLNVSGMQRSKSM
jgi:TATA-box binding protein (TBP) (component of TFIID and TFIIIB)